MKLAEHLANVKPSSTLLLSQKAALLRSQGKDIISLSTGEPDFPTPLWVCDAATQAMNRGETRYTSVEGTMALRQAVQEKFQRDQGVHYDVSEIMVGSGAKQVIYNALAATLNPDDEVIIPAPYWVSYPDMVRLVRGKPVFVPCPARVSFKLQPEDLAKAITPRTRWLILNTPGNPTGMVYDSEELKKLAAVLDAHPHVAVLCDDIYEQMIYEGSFTSLIQVAPQLKDRLLLVNGLSKSHNMTGWRMGYGAGPKELIKAMTLIQSQSTSHPSSITQAASVKALTGPQAFRDEQNQAFRQRRDRAMAILSSCPLLEVFEPQGAFYLFVGCQAVLDHGQSEANGMTTDTHVAAYLLDCAEVAVVPGEAFGMSPFFRLSYAIAMDQLETACHRMVQALADLSG